MIAKYYKYISILPNEEIIDGQLQPLFKKNIKFDPKDFAQEEDSKLGLFNHARFGDEHLIMFNEK